MMEVMPVSATQTLVSRSRLSSQCLDAAPLTSKLAQGSAPRRRLTTTNGYPTGRVQCTCARPWHWGTRADPTRTACEINVVISQARAS